MPSFTTLFRAIVMLAVGAGVFKGWQLYGPSTEQVKKVAVSAIEMAQTAWNNYQSKDKAAPQMAEQQAAAPPFSQATLAPAAEGPMTAPALSTQSLSPSSPLEMAPIGSAAAPSGQQSITPLAGSAPPAGTNEDRIHTLLSKLEQLGGSEPTVAAWGSGGHLFRCSCQAPLANAPAVKQHFESVAAEPALAVEQVVAKVEAWRTAQRDSTMLR